MSQKQSYHLELPNFAQKITTVISILNIPIYTASHTTKLLFKVTFVCLLQPQGFFCNW